MVKKDFFQRDTMYKRIAVVDIDGILWSMAPAWYEELIKINPDIPFPGCTNSWNFGEGFMDDHIFQQTIDAVHMRQEEFGCFEGAGKLTNMLHNSGFYVKIASHRTYKSKAATKAWLNKHNIFFDELHTVDDKHPLLQDADLFIDDSPSSQQYAVSIGLPVMSIRYPYNENVYGVLFFDDFSYMLAGLRQWLASKSVTISKEEYAMLIKNNNFLIALEGSGVDNWPGYEQVVDNVMATAK